MSQRYLRASREFVAERQDSPFTAEQIGQWIDAQAACVRELCRPDRLRCFAAVMRPAVQPHMISIEFAAPDDRYHSILLHCDGGHDLTGRVVRTLDVAAGIKLLTLLADELKVPVRLQP